MVTRFKELNTDLNIPMITGDEDAMIDIKPK